MKFSRLLDFGSRAARGLTPRARYPVETRRASGSFFGGLQWKKRRRWEIALCDRGTVHLHYGTGSLHILKEDFLDLAVELQQLANRLAVISGNPSNSKQERTLAVAMSDIIAIIIKGGLVMIPLLLCSVVALAVTIERFLYWRRISSKKPVEQMLLSVEQGKFPRRSRRVKIRRYQPRGCSPPAWRTATLPIPRPWKWRRRARCRSSNAVW